MGRRIALFFKAGRQWLTSAPRYRGALLCGLFAIGAMIAIGHNGNKNVSLPSKPVVQPGDVMPTPYSAVPNKSGARDTQALPAESHVRDAEALKPLPVNNNTWNEKEGPTSRVILSDKSFLVADSEKEKAVIQEKHEPKKSARKSTKKKQRRPASEEDRNFSPSREIERTRKKITDVIRRIF